MAFSADGTNASTSAASERLQGSTRTLSPSLPASVSSTSRRVPEIATVAPCACKACAIAPPMPPVAPVTSAVLPVRSNIIVSPRSGRLRGNQRVFRRGNIVRSANRNTYCAVGDALDQPAEHSAGADFEKPDDTVARHVGHRLAPAHGSRDLFDQASADLVRIGNRRGQYVGHQRRNRSLDGDAGKRLRDHV